MISKTPSGEEPAAALVEPVVASMEPVASSASAASETAAAAAPAVAATPVTVPPGTCFVQTLPRDPLAVEAEYLGGPGFGQLTDKLKTLATPPLEFCATLAENFKAGESITVQGPLGPITVEPPPEAQAGMSLRYSLCPGQSSGCKCLQIRNQGLRCALTAETESKSW